MRFPKLLAVLVCLLAPTAASAAPCFGASPFTDVDAGETYCTSTEWLKNRSITLGCTATTYCPNDFVTRAQMALFMNRLGTALTTLPIQDDDDTGPLDLDVDTTVCQTFDVSAGTFQKTVTAHMTFSGRTGGALTLAADLVFSTNGGSTWSVLAPAGNFNRVGHSASGVWVNASQTLSRTLLAGSQTRFGIRIMRIDGTGDLTASRCFINVQIGNRNEPLF